MKPFKYLKSSIRRHFDSRKLENLNYADRHRLRYAELSIYVSDEYAIQSDNPR